MPTTFGAKPLSAKNILQITVHGINRNAVSFNRCNSENCNIILIFFYYGFTRYLKAIQTICLCHYLLHTKRAFTLIQARVGGGLIQFISFYILYKNIFSYSRSWYFLRRRFLKGLTPLQMSYNFTLHIFRYINPNYMRIPFKCE